MRGSITAQHRSTATRPGRSLRCELSSRYGPRLPSDTSSDAVRRWKGGGERMRLRTTIITIEPTLVALVRVGLGGGVALSMKGPADLHGEG